MIGKLVVFVLVAAVHQSAGLKLPNYFKPCSRNDPKFAECALRHGKEAIPTLVKGDRKYRLPNLNPFIIEEFTVEQGKNLRVSLTDDHLYGLDKSELKKINIDFAKKKGEIEILIPELHSLGTYNMSGRILVLPITGHGPADIYMYNVTVQYVFPYDLYKNKQTKEEHMRPKKGKIEFDASAVNIRLDNLFNGNKVLGDTTLTFLNRNWRLVKDDLGPIVSDAVAQIIHQIIGSVCELVPYDELFPEKV